MTYLGTKVLREEGAADSCKPRLLFAKRAFETPQLSDLESPRRILGALLRSMIINALQHKAGPINDDQIYQTWTINRTS